MLSKKTNIHYEQLVASEFAPIYDAMLPIFGIVMSIYSIMSWFWGTGLFYVIFSFVLSLLFFVFHLIRHKIPTTLHVAVGSSIFYILSFVQIYQNGIESIATVVLLLVMMASIVFLPKFISYIHIAFTFFVLFLLPLINVYLPQFSSDALLKISYTKYYTSLFGFLLLVIIVVIYYVNMSNSLVQIISNLEKQVHLTEEKTHQLNHLAYFDTLTGLPNKFFFEQKFEPVLKSNCGYFVLLDIREFKIINSLYGSDIGDIILKRIGEEIPKFENSGVDCARIGGNEFAFCFRDMDEESVIRFIQEHNTAFNEKYFSDIGFKSLGFYIAIVEVTPEIKNFDQLLNMAMITLSNCKKTPHAPYIKFSDALIQSARESDALLNYIKKSIESESVEIYYQVKVDARSEAVVGVEALARLKNDEGQFISPGQFIPMIERSNLAVPFGELIFKKVIQDMPQLICIYSNQVQVSINISPTHLLSKGFLEFIDAIVNSSSIDKRNIVLEITEDVFIANIHEVKSLFNDLRVNGFRVSLDDFGSGYSSLNYVMEMPMDEIKIDRSFTIQLLENPKTQLMMKVIFDMANILGLHIVVEGVENQQQLEILKQLGNCTIQGYLFSVPKPLSEIA